MKRNTTLLITVPLMVVLIGLALYQYVYVGIQADVASIKEEQALKTEMLEKYITLISEKSPLEETIVTLKEIRIAEGLKLVEGQTLSLAAATLQDTVKEIITSRGGTISSERVGKPEDHENFKIITVSVDSVLPDPGTLSDILYSIETEIPYLAITQLDVRVRNFRNPRELMVKLSVSALTSSR
jgi:hypothetical protein